MLLGHRGCFFNSALFLVLIFVPILGHVIETLMILEDDHSSVGKIFWLLVVWLLPFIGSFIYLLFGQRPVNRGRVMFGQASYYQPQGYYQNQQQTW